MNEKKIIKMKEIDEIKKKKITRSKTLSNYTIFIKNEKKRKQNNIINKIRCKL